MSPSDTDLLLWRFLSDTRLVVASQRLIECVCGGDGNGDDDDGDGGGSGVSVVYIGDLGSRCG